MDVKKTFLHKDLEEEIYMKKLEGFVVKGKKELVCKLKKSLYGLKLSPRMWYHKFGTYRWGLRFTRRKENCYVYFKLIGDHVIYLVLCVDDMLLIGNDKEFIQDLKTQLSFKFDMKDIGAANYIFGMEIKRDREKRKQRMYVETILQRFNMKDSKLVKVHIPIGVKLYIEQCLNTQAEEQDMSHVPYVSVVGSLMYEIVYTRPDIANVVEVLSRFMSKPRKENWTTVKWVFIYLYSISDYGLCYQGRLGLDRILDTHSFVDEDWAANLDQIRYTSGYVFNLYGGAVSWMRKTQSLVALSTTEIEYMAATLTRKEAVWLKIFCSCMGLVQQAIRIDCDSQSEIFLVKNPSYHSNKNHIDVQYHFVRDMVEDKKVLLLNVDTLNNVEYALMNYMNTKKFT